MYGNILPLNDSYSLENVRAHGATHYYDKSLDDDPPSWSDTGEEVFVEYEKFIYKDRSLGTV